MRRKFTRWTVLQKYFNFNIEYVPGKSNELRNAFFREPGEKVFVVNLTKAEEFLLPEKGESKRPKFSAFLNAAELRRQIVESQVPNLQDSQGGKDSSPLPTHVA
jgi:hypothetical protein